MPFHSILSQESDEGTEKHAHEDPSVLGDLNLDQTIDAITADWKEYDLSPFYYARLKDLNAITYRQEVVRDLEDRPLLQVVKTFSERMRVMREYLAQGEKIHYYKYAMERRFLGAVEIYCEAVEGLSRELDALDIRSRGLRAFRDYLAEYVCSPAFLELLARMGKLLSDLLAAKYCLLLKNGSVTVRHYDGEGDYSIALEETFEKFRHGSGGGFHIEIRKWEGMNHIEAQIQDRVALLYPGVFGALDSFFAEHGEYLDPAIARFDREVQFYVAYLTYVGRFRSAGLSFCRPQLSQSSKAISGNNAFDLALAKKLLDDKATVITNDFFLAGAERIFVVSGPNQGGKTTFARTIGQLHYLACLGLPVPGSKAELFVPDCLFTHFEHEEDITTLRGKLQDDLVRIRQILDAATPDSLIIINEMFSSTALKDAVFLSKKVMENISALDPLCVWVTFLDELASFNEKTVSIVSTVEPENPAVRTFKLERRRADGLAYALAIAQKYRVTYAWLKERIKA